MMIVLRREETFCNTRKSRESVFLHRRRIPLGKLPLAPAGVGKRNRTDCVELADYFLEVMQNKRRNLEAELVDALHTPTISIEPEELEGRSMVSVLREKLGKP
jgi:hypothetical protein